VRTPSTFSLFADLRQGQDRGIRGGPNHIRGGGKRKGEGKKRGGGNRHFFSNISTAAAEKRRIQKVGGCFSQRKKRKGKKREDIQDLLSSVMNSFRPIRLNGGRKIRAVLWRQAAAREGKKEKGGKRGERKEDAT